MIRKKSAPMAIGTSRNLNLSAMVYLQQLRGRFAPELGQRGPDTDVRPDARQIAQGRFGQVGSAKANGPFESPGSALAIAEARRAAGLQESTAAAAGIAESGCARDRVLQSAQRVQTDLKSQQPLYPPCRTEPSRRVPHLGGPPGIDDTGNDPQHRKRVRLRGQPAGDRGVVASVDHADNVGQQRGGAILKLREIEIRE